MRNIVTSILILTLAGVASANESFLRLLDDDNKNGTKGKRPPPPKKYDDDLKIDFKANLGCGACIRGGFVYCIPGPEGSDPDTWAGKKSVCCKDASCAQVKDTANFNCSNSYTDAMMAKAICPFNRRSCGNNTAFSFDSVGQKQSINITLNKGEACTFQVEAQCGLPAFKPNDTTGFDIETIDYDDDDLDSTGIQAQEREDRSGNSTNKTDPKGPRKEFGSDKKPPKPPKIAIPKRSDRPDQEKKGPANNNGTKNGNKTENENQKKKGPEAKRFNPDEKKKGESQKFKNGVRNGNENICKRRFQQLSVTALGDVNSTTARILQTEDPEVYIMTLEIGSEDFSGAVSKMVGLALVAVISAVSLIF